MKLKWRNCFKTITHVKEKNAYSNSFKYLYEIFKASKGILQTNDYLIEVEFQQLKRETKRFFCSQITEQISYLHKK